MSSRSRHPAESTLAAYAAGNLDHGLSLVIATHLATCPDCRRVCEAAEALGGAVMEDVRPGEVSGSLLRDILSALTREPVAKEVPEVARPSGPTWHGLPAPLSDMLPADEADLKWWTVAPGLRLASLPGMGPSDGIRLLRIRPGKAVPEHGHGGHELTIVIQGAYEDTDGTYHAGDIADMDHDDSHQPVAIGDQDCICVIATDARLEFSGLTPRLLQPIIGI